MVKHYHHVQIGSSGTQIASIECEYKAEAERLHAELERLRAAMITAAALADGDEHKVASELLRRTLDG